MTVKSDSQERVMYYWQRHTFTTGGRQKTLITEIGIVDWDNDVFYLESFCTGGMAITVKDSNQFLDTRYSWVTRWRNG